MIVITPACSPRADSSPDAFRGRHLAAPLDSVTFTLPDTDGRPFHFGDQTRGRLTFLFFGYTNCPDVCPIHMAALASVLQRLPFETRDRISVVFVSTDPDRDTPERIREWLDTFDPTFIGLRGDIATVNRIQQQLGLPPSSIATDDAGGYMVGHAAQVLAFQPDGVARYAYPFGTRREDWLHDIPRLLRP